MSKAKRLFFMHANYRELHVGKRREYHELRAWPSTLDDGQPKGCDEVHENGVGQTSMGSTRR